MVWRMGACDHRFEAEGAFQSIAIEPIQSGPLMSGVNVPLW